MDISAFVRELGVLATLGYAAIALGALVFFFADRPARAQQPAHERRAARLEPDSASSSLQPTT
jgi:hypothetical protein